MSEILLFSMAVSLLLVVIYGFTRRQKEIVSELQAARRIGTLAAAKVASGSSVPVALRGILAALSEACDAKIGRLDFQGILLGNFSCGVGDEALSPSGFPEGTKEEPHAEKRELWDSGTSGNSGQIAFNLEDEDYSCRIYLRSKTFLSSSEYRTIQGLIKDKISRCMHDKMSKTVRTAFESGGIPCAIIDGAGKVIYKNEMFALSFRAEEEREISKCVTGLIDSKRDFLIVPPKDSAGQRDRKPRKVVIEKIGEGLFAAFSRNEPNQTPSEATGESNKLIFNAIDDLNLGVVVLERDDSRHGRDFKIVSINKAFYRIFGLAGSNAQLEEVDEILSTAVGPDRRNDLSGKHFTGDFYYMRRDGIKVRARLIVFKADDNSLVVVFEPIENSQLLISSYRRLMIAAESLFKSGDVRSYLKELRDVTRSDGITLAKKRKDSSSFELTDKAGFVINVPQLVYDDLQSRELLNYQGYVIVPMKHGDAITGALIALRPSEDETELVVAGTRLLEAHEMIKSGLDDIHFYIAKVASEAERADSANRFKSEFLVNMSHEIRTPLNSIIGFANIIHDDASELPQDLLGEFSGNIVTAGNHLLNLINDILDLAKVETGKMEMDPQEFIVLEVVQGVERILKPVLDKKRITLDVNIEEKVKTFVADTVKFKQILYNLLNNAVTYSHENSSVELVIVKSASGIEMKVIDKGIGIKREDLDKLFKPFVQLGGENGGTGLGLQLTKRLVELHGGAIWVDSTFGMGTTVVVYLPEYKSQNFHDSQKFSPNINGVVQWVI